MNNAKTQNKQKRKIKIWLVFVLLFALSTVSFAEIAGYSEDPIRIGVGARLMGMGRAFVGVADDGSAVFVNPAGLAGLNDWHFLTMNANVLNDVNYLSLSYASPFQFRGLKMGWGMAYVGSGVAGIPSPSSSGFTYFNYYNNVYLLSLAGQINKKLSVGLNYKMFYEGFTGSVAAAGSGGDLDLGIKYNHNDRAAFGLTVQNALPASMGGKVDWGTYDESLPALLKVGGAFKLNDRLSLAIDNDMWLSRRLPSQLHAGLEWDINPLLVLRGGIDQSLSSADGGVASNPTFGVGLRLWNAMFDYAYHPYFGESGALTHYFSLSFSPAIQKRSAALAALAAKATPEALPPAQTAEEIVIEEMVVAPTTAVSMPEAEAVKRVFHYVSVGDTLSEIAEKYYGNHYSYHKLAELNDLKDPDLIIAGQWLKVPYKLNGYQIIKRFIKKFIGSSR